MTADAIELDAWPPVNPASIAERALLRRRRALHELREAIRVAEQRHADKLVEIREALAESEVYLAEVCELRGELMTALAVPA